MLSAGYANEPDRQVLFRQVLERNYLMFQLVTRRNYGLASLTGHVLLGHPARVAIDGRTATVSV
jgi:hypothetical protein